MSRLKTRQHLLTEVADLRQRLDEAEETLLAIRNGEVDALVVGGPNGDNVYTLSGADHPYRVLIEAMSEGALTLSTDGIVLYSNARFADLLRVPLEHVIGQPFIHFIAADDWRMADSLIAGSGAIGGRIRARLVRSDGATVPAQVSTQPIDVGGPQTICVIVTDLTSVIQAEESLRKAHDELERRVEERTAELRHSNEMRLRFLAMISHELRTPLTSIKGFASTLLANDVSWGPEEQHEFIYTIDVEADKLTEMIDQILDLSRLETGMLRINPERARVSDVVTMTLPQLQALTNDHRLMLDVPEDAPALRIDRQRMAQVFLNLVGNAAKFSAPGTAIRLSAHRVDSGVRVDVSDEGPGIAPQDRKQVFEAFRRGNDSRVKHTKGAGLGLAICKGIVEAHGGRIWIEDGDPQARGTTISFVLPLNGTAP
jgi:PAS domain S-box-containing protein